MQTQPSILFPLLGGVLIAVSSTIMLAALGRITGISGIFSSSLFEGPKKDNVWRISFIIGLVFGGFFFAYFFPHFFDFELKGNLLKYAIAGLLVGYGTRLGSGCTSGHGVCGLARLKQRSIVATLTFILFGIITVLVERGLS